MTDKESDWAQQSPSLTLRAAVRQFNDGDYFLCHETLEDLWIGEERPIRNVYQGILQIGIGLLHLQRGNKPGARTLLEQGMQRLQPFLPTCFKLDLASLCEEATKILNRLNDPTHEQPLFFPGKGPQIRIIEPPAS